MELLTLAFDHERWDGRGYVRGIGGEAGRDAAPATAGAPART